MSSFDSLKQLVKLLDESGVRSVEGHPSEPLVGFPVVVPLNGGSSICLDLPTPGIFGSLDSEAIGFTILDPLGYARRTWGLATKIPLFKPGFSVVDTPLLSLLHAGMAGKSSTAFIDGYRYFAAPVPTQGRSDGGAISDVFVLVVSASEELAAKHKAAQSERFANALKRVGKVLTMNQGIAQICQAAAHEVTSATELSAAMVWIASPDGLLRLSASVGLTRPGVLEVETLDKTAEPRCVAEIVASAGRKFFQRSVHNHVMTAGLEANSCYLKPGGVYAYPLMAGGKLLGVVEIVGRDGDPHFEGQDELFETFAEHLSLAINAAMMFEEAERFASHDALTGIANHRTMQEFFERRVIEAHRNQVPVSVLMLDVDHFRSFNEEEGHDAGDDVLRQVATKIAETVRTQDLAARYGGEEFTVIMPGALLAEAQNIGERIRQAIAATPFHGSGGRPRHVTISVGAAAYPETAVEATKLLKAADVALYQAKRSGRNQVKAFEGVYDGEKPSAGRTSLEIEQWIRPEVAKFTAEFQEWAEPHVEALGTLLQLSQNQIGILAALVQIAPTYRLLSKLGETDALAAMTATNEFRLLLPALEAFEERADGRGPRRLQSIQIPLLARVLQILLASFEGEALWEDSERFDEEILQLHLPRRKAA